MSISLLQTPASVLLSAGNDNIWTISGDTLGAPNVFEYKYMADVFVNGKFATTLTSFPDFSFGFGVFNTKNIIQSFIGYDFFPEDDPTELIKQCPASSAVIQLQFGEEYISGTTFVQTRNIVDSDTKLFINSSLSFPDQVNTDLEDYVPFDGKQNVLTLNDNPRLSSIALGETTTQLNFVVYTNQRMWLYVSNDRYDSDRSAFLQNIFVLTYGASGNLLGEYQATSLYDSSDATDIQSVPVGVPQLALWNADNSTLVSGSFPIITPDVAFYQVFLQSSAGNEWEPSTFTIKNDCGRFSDTAYTIHWLNTLGGFNSWLFNKKNETTQQKTVQKYKKQYGTLNADGSYSIKTSDQVNRPYYTVLQDTITMTTDFLSDSDVLYLKNLVSSPVVYMEDQSGLITAIEIVDDSYRINKKVNQKIYSLEMKINQSANNYRQQG